MTANPNPDYLESVIDAVISDLIYGHKRSAKMGKISESLGAVDISNMHRDLADSNAKYFSPEVVDSPEVAWPMDITWANPSATHSDGSRSDWQILRYRSASAREVRGLSILPAKHMLKRTAASLWSDGRLDYQDAHYFSWVRDRWIPSDPKRRPLLGQATIDDENIRCKMALSAALTARYNWHVVIKDTDDSGLAVKFATDPVGVKSLFKDRDRNPASDRRDALRHWVKGHWRQSRIDPEAKSFVRQHLRGKTPFTWNGYACLLCPSDFDIESVQDKRPERVNA